MTIIFEEQSLGLHTKVTLHKLFQRRRGAACGMDRTKGLFEELARRRLGMQVNTTEHRIYNL
jgi:hypothetical protein